MVIIRLRTSFSAVQSDFAFSQCPLCIDARDVRLPQSDRVPAGAGELCNPSMVRDFVKKKQNHGTNKNNEYPQYHHV